MTSRSVGTVIVTCSSWVFSCLPSQKITGLTFLSLVRIWEQGAESRICLRTAPLLVSSFKTRVPWRGVAEAVRTGEGFSGLGDTVIFSEKDEP